jgi:hypothetical protein
MKSENKASSASAAYGVISGELSAAQAWASSASAMAIGGVNENP